ncbi:MAG TPA: GDSL-type esterase/lipase family protein [Pseudonocardia sp.]|nr:GDSL-type esterase/lipase family protein [Pseudonocardia sp.]
MVLEQRVVTVDGSPTRRASGFRHELRAWPTLMLVLFCLVVGLPVTITLTPEQDVTALGQPLSVGARPPSLSVSGPARLVQIGNTALDLPRLRVVGPLRPQLSIGPIQRNDAAALALDPSTGGQAQSEAVRALTGGFLRWYLWGGLGLLLFTAAAAAAAGCLRLLVTLRRQSRPGREHHTVVEIWHHYSGAIRRMTVIALAASTVAWGVSGALAYAGTVDGLRGVNSLPELFGASVAATPPPVGPEVFDVRGAVIGDSRAVRVGGPPLPDPEPADVACGRSADSLAAELGRLVSAPVANLACPGASTVSGLRGPQQRGELVLPPQVGLLRQLRDLEFVVVAIGPNDLAWTDFITYCYAVQDCADRLSEGEFAYRLAAFDREYGALLADLAALPTRPQVVVVTSYDVFPAGADCPDTRGPDAVPGLSAPEIALLTERNGRLNAVLRAGAEKYGFDVARPSLALLCDPAAGVVGPDLQGLVDPFPFHPTGTGSLRLAAEVARWIPPERGEG